MTALALVFCGAAGVHLLYTRVVFGRTRLLPERPARSRPAAAGWLHQAGLPHVRWRDFLAACSILALLAFLVAWAVFGGVVPGIVAAAVAITIPPATMRARRERRLAHAQEAWPRLIEEFRVLVTSSGLSIPQALFTVGRRAPAELAEGFEIAHREWLLTTDFERAIRVLKDELAHPSADATCETLLTAHTVGGVDLDRRLHDLAEDRLADAQARKDARAKLAGARFARGFVLAVPVGMALVGLSIGRGRTAYESALAQGFVAVGLVLIVGCWVWAGRIMAVPGEQRVFSG